MTTRIKICGITRVEDALFAAEAGADYLGFVLAPGTKRTITAEKLAGFSRDLPGSVKKVGVFVNCDDREIRRAMDLCALDIVQLHGTEQPRFADLLSLEYEVWKAVPFMQSADFAVCEAFRRNILILDSDKRCGGQCSWRLAQLLTRRRKIILAGGLNVENIRNAVQVVTPFGVDVAGGVESSPGVKDHNAIAEFINQVRLADRFLEDTNENAF